MIIYVNGEQVKVDDDKIEIYEPFPEIKQENKNENH